MGGEKRGRSHGGWFAVVAGVAACLVLVPVLIAAMLAAYFSDGDSDQPVRDQDALALNRAMKALSSFALSSSFAALARLCLSASSLACSQNS